jgi:hypothetical protein
MTTITTPILTAAPVCDCPCDCGGGCDCEPSCC